MTGFLRFATCKNQNTPYLLGAVGTKRAPGEARLRDKASGRGEVLM
jgi:hypothetical protein